MQSLIKWVSVFLVSIYIFTACKTSDADKLIGDWKLAYFDIDDDQKNSEAIQYTVKVYQSQLEDKYFFFNNGQYGLVDNYGDTLQSKPYTVHNDEIHLEEAVSQFSFSNDTLLVKEKGKGTIMKLYRYQKK